MAIDGPVFITPHAVARFRQRVAPGLTEAAAMSAIIDSLANVESVTPARNGLGVIVRTREPYAIRAVVMPGEGDAPTVVTVMPGRHGRSPSDARHRRLSRAKLLLRMAGERGMAPLRITAHLRTGYAASDPWSPSIDGILAYWRVIERDGVDAAMIAAGDDGALSAVDDLPLLQDGCAAPNGGGRLWWYCASSPIPAGDRKFHRHYHRRFDVDAAAQYMVPKAGKISTSAGPYKNSRLRHTVHAVPSVTWHVIGSPDGVVRLLSRCAHIGRGIASGHGRVSQWDVEMDGDAETAAFLRPLPVALRPRYALRGMPMRWGLAPPQRLAAHQVDCIMPDVMAANDAAG